MMKRTASSKYCVAFGLLSAAATAQAATPDNAESPAAADPAPAEVSPEIIVTANKRAESVNKVGATIVAASGEKLIELGVKGVDDLRTIVPGFASAESATGTPVYYIRGVGFADTSVSSKPTVSLYADEVPLPYSVMALGASLDLERVEVLKGPQGTLFGSNATGGAVNFIAAKPTDHFSAGGYLSVGRFADVTGEGFVSGPLSSTVKARLAISHESAESWQYDYTRPARNGAIDVTSGRAIVDFDPTDRLHFALTTSGTIDRSDQQQPQYVGFGPRALPVVMAFPFAPANDRATSFGSSFPLNGSRERDDYQWQIALRGDLKLSDGMTLTSLTAYARSKQAYAIDVDGTIYNVVNYYIEGKIKSFTQELRLNGDFSGHGHWIVGGNIESSDTHEVQNYDLSDAAPGHAFDVFHLPPIDAIAALEDTHTRSQAGFGDVTYDLLPRLTVHGGVRYTSTILRFDGCAEDIGNQTYSTGISAILRVPRQPAGACVTYSPDPANPGHFIAGLVSSRLKEHNLSWRGGIDYKPVAGTLLYASVSRGFKGGAFSDIGAVFASQYVPAVQEQLTAYELGLKSDVIPHLLHVNAAAYYYNYINKQAQGRVDTGPPFRYLAALVTIPRSRVAGAELEATLRPAPGLELSGAVTYVASKVLGTTIVNANFGPIIDIEGSPFPKTAKWQTNLSASYTRPVSSRLNMFAGLNLITDSSTNSDFLPQVNVPGNPYQLLAIKPYAVLDGRIGIAAQDDSWRFMLWGKNLTNTYYYPTTNTNSEVAVRFTGKPVTYGATLSLRYR